eukprot:g347.t1
MASRRRLVSDAASQAIRLVLYDEGRGSAETYNRSPMNHRNRNRLPNIHEKYEKYETHRSAFSQRTALSSFPKTPSPSKTKKKKPLVKTSSPIKQRKKKRMNQLQTFSSLSLKVKSSKSESPVRHALSPPLPRTVLKSPLSPPPPYAALKLFFALSPLSEINRISLLSFCFEKLILHFCEEKLFDLCCQTMSRRIQRWYRKQLETRTNYTSAVSIQRFYRSYRTRRQEIYRNSLVLVQKHIRGFLSRRQVARIEKNRLRHCLLSIFSPSDSYSSLSKIYQLKCFTATRQAQLQKAIRLLTLDEHPSLRRIRWARRIALRAASEKRQCDEKLHKQWHMERIQSIKKRQISIEKHHASMLRLSKRRVAQIKLEEETAILARIEKEDLRRRNEEEKIFLQRQDRLNRMNLTTSSYGCRSRGSICFRGVWRCCLVSAKRNKKNCRREIFITVTIPETCATLTFSYDCKSNIKKGGSQFFKRVILKRVEEKLG